ncbi:MAG: hypothetical protein ACREQL_06920, partial [Candidatus Binatia bacterium]
MTPGHANRPRWRGEAGFFEIWFVVVLDLVTARAWWFRYTTLAPRQGAPRGTLWAAAFEEGRPPVFGKAFVSTEEIAAHAGGLERGVCRGRVGAAASPIEWDLQFEPASCPAQRGPRWLHRLPTPTRVAHCNQETGFRGTIRVGDREHVVADGRGAQKHLWGARRVEELFWIYAPVLRGGGAFEASSVRMRQGRGPAVAPVWMHDGIHERTWWGIPGLFRNRVEPREPGALHV